MGVMSVGSLRGYGDMPALPSGLDPSFRWPWGTAGMGGTDDPWFLRPLPLLAIAAAGYALLPGHAKTPVVLSNPFKRKRRKARRARGKRRRG